MKYAIVAASVLLVTACSVITGVSNSCSENKLDGTRMCTTIDSSQNITTRSIERNHKLFVSTCSNGNCTEYKEIGAAEATTK